MTELALAFVVTLAAATPLHLERGVASQYAPGTMERVVRVRQSGRTWHDLPETLPEVDGYAAVLDCGDVGRLVLVRPPNRPWELFLAADCAGIADGGRDWMVRGGIALEVDHLSAVRWDTIGRGAMVDVVWIQGDEHDEPLRCDRDADPGAGAAARIRPRVLARTLADPASCADVAPEDLGLRRVE